MVGLFCDRIDERMAGHGAVFGGQARPLSCLSRDIHVFELPQSRAVLEHTMMEINPICLSN